MKTIIATLVLTFITIGGGYLLLTTQMSKEPTLKPATDIIPEVTTQTAAMSDADTNIDTVAVFETTLGTFEVLLYTKLMPITTENFITLARNGLYDDTKFHRIINDFMIQGGDPLSASSDPSVYGTGGPGYTIEDEFVSDPKLSNTRGTVAMANTGQPNSGGSQFFINTGDNTRLDFDKSPETSKHPVFGIVVDGMEVVDAINRVETDESDVPLEPVVVTSITIKRRTGDEVK